MSQMLKASGAMAAATMASRILGLGREMAYAAFMGNGWVASAFALAFQVPNLFRRLLGEGALTAAFIPMFKRKQHLEGEAEMWRCANAVISGLVAATIAISVLVVLGISAALVWGKFSAETTLMLRLLRLMFPYMVLVCLAAALIGMANARGHFFVPAMGAALLNIVMIASVLWLAPHMGRSLEEQVFGLAIGVLLAGLVQAFFQLPSLSREGFSVPMGLAVARSNGAGRGQKDVAGSIGSRRFRINVLLITMSSWFFDETIVSTFNYAVRLMELPRDFSGFRCDLPAAHAFALAAEKRYPDFRATLRQDWGIWLLRT
jgi:putative peptidoglycan lipid II flippase